MNKIIIMLILLSSCSTQNLLKDETSQFQSIEIVNSDSAKKFITNKINFYKSIFVQSYDPYYNTPRWQPKCLTDNQIADIKETANGIFSINRLYLNKKMDAGFCPESDSKYYHHIYYYCFKSPSKLFRISIEVRNENTSKNWTQLCD